QSLAALAETSLSSNDRIELIAIVDDYVFGHALRAGELRSRIAMDPAEAEAAIEFAVAQLRTGRYPRTEALLGGRDPREAARDPGDSPLTVDRFEQVFERGLEALLDGLAVRMGLPGA